MKKLEKNPLYLYMGQPCAVCDTNEPVSDFIEGCDFVQDKVIAERTTWEPEIIKPILRDISDMNKEEAIEAVNIAWWPINRQRIEEVELKTTPLFPHAGIYFKWPIKENIPDGVSEEEWRKENGEFHQDEFILSFEKSHNTIRLVRVLNEEQKVRYKTEYYDMPIYQSHKLTAYLISKGFDLGLLEEGTFVIRNKH